CPTTDEYHLGIGILGKEVTEGAVYGYLVSRFQIKDPGRHQTRRDIGPPRWRRGNANIELDDTALFRIVRHRVGTGHGFSGSRFDIEETILFPVGAEPFLNIEIAVLDVIRWRLQLDIATRTEVDILPLGQPQCQ